METKLSTHYLRRRAEAQAKRIRGWQRRIRALDTGECGMGTTRDAKIRQRLDALGVTDGDVIDVRKRGRWDARYDVVAVHRSA